MREGKTLKGKIIDVLKKEMFFFHIVWYVRLKENEELVKLQVSNFKNGYVWISYLEKFKLFKTKYDHYLKVI